VEPTVPAGAHEPVTSGGGRAGISTVKALARRQSYIWLTWLNDVIFTLAALALVYLTASTATLVTVSAIGLARLVLLARERGRAATAAAAAAVATAEAASAVVEGPEPAHPAEEAEDASPPGLGSLHVSARTLNGVWRKDRAASEPMDAAMDLVALNPIVRRAVRLVNGLELEISDTEFRMAVLCAIPWFKIREDYPLGGEPARHKRRDLRRGQSVGSVKLQDGKLLLSMSWGDPHGGSGVDTYSLVGPDTLHVHCTYEVSGETAAYTHVYQRRQ